MRCSTTVRPPREPIRMTDVVSGGLQEDALLLFGKEEMGLHLLGHRGIRRKAEIFNSAHLENALLSILSQKA